MRDGSRRLLIQLMIVLAIAWAVPTHAQPTVASKTIYGARVVIFGDSISAGSGKNDWTHWTAALKKRFDLDVINAGVGGNTTTQALSRIDRDVLDKRPDFVLISFGMNDHVMRSVDHPKVALKTFENNLAEIVAKVRAAGATPIFVTTNYIVEGDPKDTTKNYYYHRHDPAFYANVGGAQKWLDQYIDAMRAIAKKLDVPIADVRSACNEHDPKLFTSDGVHPAKLGQQVYAQVVGDLLEQRFGK